MEFSSDVTPTLDRFLRLKEVAFTTGCSRSSIYLKIQQGLFPKPIKIGTRASRWRESEVIHWMDDLTSQDNPVPAKARVLACEKTSGGKASPKQ